MCTYVERENSFSIVFIDYSRKRGTTEMKKEISTPLAPAAIGPYSQGIETDSMIFTSGQLPINMQTGELETDPKKATQASLNHIKSILKQAGYDMTNIVKVTIFVADMNHFASINETYAEFFGGVAPARSCVEVAKLPKDAILEIEAIAVKNK